MTRISLALVTAFGLGCSGGTNPSPPPPANSVAVTTNQFTPASLTVTPNTTVTWNFNSGTHNVTFEDGQGNVGDRTSGTHTRSFSAAGTFRYRCTNHSTNFTSGMIGSVVVN